MSRVRVSMLLCLLSVCEWGCWCDVITVMVFHWGLSLNEDIKAVAVFICMERWYAGSVSLEVSTHAQWVDIQIHTGTQSYIQMNKIMYVRGLSALFKGTVYLSLCFCNMHINTGRASIFLIFLFICITIISPVTLSLRFMSRDWLAYYYHHYCYYAFRVRKVTLNLTEAGGITAAINRLLWFMIYAYKALILHFV